MPTTIIVAKTNPIASVAEYLKEDSRASLLISLDSKYISGATITTINMFGSKDAFGKNGNSAAIMPIAICTSGTETLGIKRSKNDDRTTTAIMYRISSKIGILL